MHASTMWRFCTQASSIVSFRGCRATDSDCQSSPPAQSTPSESCTGDALRPVQGTGRALSQLLFRQ